MNILDYKYRFNKLIESKLGDVRPILCEQPDSKMPFQPEKFGYEQGKPETVKPSIEKQQEVLADPHAMLTLSSIAAGFVPLVGPLIAAGISLAQAAIYLKQGDTKNAGLVSILSMIPFAGPVVSKIPAVAKLGQTGMVNLGTKLANNQKLTQIEKEVVDGLAANSDLVTQELSNLVKSQTQIVLKDKAIKGGLRTTLNKISQKGIDAGKDLTKQGVIYGTTMTTYNTAYDKIFNESVNRSKKILTEGYNQKVADIQRVLIKKGYYLGSYGPNGDGIDGKLGPLTKRAYQKEFGKSIETVLNQSFIKPQDKPQQSNKTSVKSSYDAVLIGGLDYRDGDYSIDQQVRLLKTSFNGNIKGFRYNASTTDILNFLKENPRIYVIMFSAGCRKAKDISGSPNVDLNKIIIVEPYAVKGNSAVVDAVSNGVPANHVFVGSNSARGKGVVSGAVSSQASSHWDALKYIGNHI